MHAYCLGAFVPCRACGHLGYTTQTCYNLHIVVRNYLYINIYYYCFLVLKMIVLHLLM